MRNGLLATTISFALLLSLSSAAYSQWSPDPLSNNSFTETGNLMLGPKLIVADRRLAVCAYTTLINGKFTIAVTSIDLLSGRALPGLSDIVVPNCEVTPDYLLNRHFNISGIDLGLSRLALTWLGTDKRIKYAIYDVLSGTFLDSGVFESDILNDLSFPSFERFLWVNTSVSILLMGGFGNRRNFVQAGVIFAS